MPLFQDRTDAGQQLAKKLSIYKDRTDVVVLGLLRGGVPVAFEVAQALHLPLDIFSVRKLALPGHEEWAMGALASGGVRVLNNEVITGLRISQEVIDAVAEREQQALERLERTYRAARLPLSLQNRVVILVDDGLATSASLAAAVTGLHAHTPAQIVVAVPIATPESWELLALNVDQVVCAETPQPFFGAGLWYGDFSQVRDDEVRDLLAQAANRVAV